MKMQSTRNRIALVTGANKGIGFEVSRQLAASGCSVLLGARNRALGEEAAATLKREGWDVRYFSIDLEDPATIATAAKDIDADFGHLDVLVNNAGIVGQGDDGLPSSSSLDAIERAFRVNFLGSVAVILRAQHDLERSGATHEASEVFCAARSGDHAERRLELTEDRRLARGKRMSQASTNSPPTPRTRPSICAIVNQAIGAQMAKHEAD
jgi:NAD(P)-dependent dehydrogenase (short-subunit alcohol dehydrogenase family)